MELDQDPTYNISTYIQRKCYAETRDAGWDPKDENSLTEELMHIVSELVEAFEHVRKGVDTTLIWYEDDGKPRGIPIEFADVFIGLLFNAEREGFSLGEATMIKMAWNNRRSYEQEGRQLH